MFLKITHSKKRWSSAVSPRPTAADERSDEDALNLLLHGTGCSPDVTPPDCQSPSRSAAPGFSTTSSGDLWPLPPRKAPQIWCNFFLTRASGLSCSVKINTGVFIWWKWVMLTGWECTRVRRSSSSQIAQRLHRGASVIQTCRRTNQNPSSVQCLHGRKLSPAFSNQSVGFRWAGSSCQPPSALKQKPVTSSMKWFVSTASPGDLSVIWRTFEEVSGPWSSCETMVD